MKSILSWCYKNITKRFPGTVLLIALILSGFSIYLASDLKFNPKMDNLLPQDLPLIKEFNEVVERTDAEIQHPPHYNQGSIECIEGIEAMLSPEEYIGYLRGNSLKYRWRYPFKNGIQDLYKAEFYEKKLLEKLLGQESDE